jgi:phosphate transport system ATP-binding protein
MAAVSLALGRASAAEAPVLLQKRTAVSAERAAPVRTAAKVSVRNLDFFYRAHKALDGINLVLHDKTVTALIGPSGCGKSTLLRVLNRIYDLYPDQRASGDVLVDGKNILDPSLDVAFLRARVGMVFQKPTPFPMSIHDNVAFGIPRYLGFSKAKIHEEVEAALRHAALWDEVKDILDHSALALSGGQQQRLCLARAIAPRPEILLLDEPCSSLDPVSTLKIEALINQLRRDYCIAIVTHNLGQAGRVSEFTGFMYQGKLVEFGTTHQMFTAPKDHHAEAFVTGKFG